MSYMERFFTTDLFAGCGGISEGFHQAGFNSVAQIEMNSYACETLKTRHLFYELTKLKCIRDYDAYVRGIKSREQIFSEYDDIREAISYRVIQETLGPDTIQTVIEKIRSSMKVHGASKIHVFIGGPPCQPYSIINRARIQKTGENSGRNYLYKYYLELLQCFQPDIFIYENVPGLFTVTDGGRRIFEKLLNDFSDLDPSYEIIPPLYDVSKNPHNYILNCSGFGVPQNRKRLILIGYRKDLERKNPDIREIHAKLRQQGIKGANKKLTVRDAISDLPHLGPGEGNNRFYGKYPDMNNLSDYQKKMRRSSEGVLNHFARAHMTSDLERYRFFIEHYDNAGKNATLKELLEERPDLAPKHKKINFDKFVDRFKVQGWTQPSSTVTAHLSKDGHYFIHPDIHQCRSFTVREAARCQTFPDNFFFEGPRTEQFRQVGNAVPPLFAKAIGQAVRHELEKVYN
jgi:DNA (cytosine-5)-methyltransferase 1